MKSTRRLFFGLGILAATVVIGIAGYMMINGWSFFDSLYMTITTITTVGYSEVHPQSTAGRIFTIFLIVGGVGGALYVLGAIVQYVLEGDIGTFWGRQRMRNKIDRLKDHFILCGFGRVGETIASTFKDEGVEFVVIDNKPEMASRAEQAGYLYLQGDATREDVLLEAGIERARGLVAAVGDDADNTYITLTGRQMRPDLFIEARASTEKTENKLFRAGANRVVSPNSIGARRMAMLAMRPAVVDFIDNISSRTGREFLMENVAISPESSFAGKSVEDFRHCSKANILAISKKSGKIIANPSGEEKILAGDSLIIIGTREQLGSLEAVCEGVKVNE